MTLLLDLYAISRLPETFVGRLDKLDGMEVERTRLSPGFGAASEDWSKIRIVLQV
jgi:hypothetical protein